MRNGNAADNGEEMRQLYMRHANVIDATCNRTGRKEFYQSTEFDPSFDLVVVDEVSKATPPELLMPLLLGRHSILVGDHRQLPPVFRSESFEEAVANEELKAEMLANFGKAPAGTLPDAPAYARMAPPVQGARVILHLLTLTTCSRNFPL